ncbi:MAG: site-specific integrase [Prevotella sp.]|nr:site-specific integrase [Prevotella sp.]
MRKNVSQKEPVRLREKPLTNGCKSLYLDIYRRGKRHKEYLRLYLIDAKTAAEREQNRQTLATAQAVRAKRQIELQNGEYSFADQGRLDIPFIEYYKGMYEERERNSDKGTHKVWRGCLKYIRLYCDEKTTFRDVTPEFVQGFKNFLNTTDKYIHSNATGYSYKEGELLSANSKLTYFSCFRACINHAYNEQILQRNPLRGVETFPKPEVKREYLTLKEIKLLDSTPCRHPWLKRSFLFSCMTGLRKSDVERLTWGDVQKQGKFTRIIFRQKKTGGQEYLDITPQAEKYMGERGADDEAVFYDFGHSVYTNLILQRWCCDAGIHKKLTFHCARHSFAILMLDLGADIYTVSKLLGHRELSTTQIYAKVLDRKKQEAVSLIPEIGQH